MLNHAIAETLIIEQVIPRGLIVHQQTYRPSDINISVDI